VGEDDKEAKEFADSGWLLDYADYDIKEFEGPERKLYAEDFLPTEDSDRHVNPLFQELRLSGLKPALLFLLLAYTVSLLDWNSSFSFSISRDSFFVGREYWRSMTALFLHADLAHLLANSWLVLIFGWLLFQVGGLISFPVLAIGIGIVTNIATVYFYPPHVNLVGASGMAYGMVGLWLTWFIRFDDTPIVKRWLRVIAFTLIVLFPSVFREEVSYLAHALGFCVGVVAGLLFRIKKDNLSLRDLH